MRAAACLWIAVLGVAALPAGAQTAGAESDYLSKDALREAGLAKFWQLRLPLDRKQRLQDAYLVDDQIYCTTDDGYVYAVHAHTGVIRFLKQVSDGNHRIKRPVHAYERTVFMTDSQITIVEKLSGDGIWRADLPQTAGSPAASDGDRIYFGSVNTRFYAYDVSLGLGVWKVMTSGQITSRPVVSQGYLFVASHDGGVYACQAADKHYHWVARTRGANSADLAIDENGLFVASEDHSLYLLDVGFGNVRWRARFSGPLYEPPVLREGVAFQYCPDDGLVAVNTATLEAETRFRWKMPRGRSLLTVDEKNAYVLTRDQTIAVADLADGTVRQTVPAPGFDRAMPSPDDGAIYLAGEDGRLFCARARSVPFLKQEDLREALAARKPEQAAEEPPAAAGRDAGEEVSDLLRSRQTGMPLGGKSKVTKSIEKGGGAPGAGTGGAGGNP